MDAKDEIKQRLDLADIIKEYVALKPAGTHAFKAVCPFHSEKTPSFHVSADKQIWRCFGCNLGGDMFSFIMQIEGVDFPEALRILGKKAGVEVARFDTREANEKQQLTKLQAFAAAYYHKVLLDASYAQMPREYCQKRGIDGTLLEKFKIGYAPDEWEAFCKIARQKGFSETDLLNGGLALRRKSGSGVIDRFRHRLMIPLKDVHGNVIAFTGRVFRSEDQPKYMNSPETLLYKKGHMLYGLDLAKQAIRLADAAILVEGNLDVVASHKAGVENVVATSGTALTEMQINLLKRFTQNLIFSFDADAAGFAAAQRGMHLAQAAGMNLSVVFIPDAMGKDPDEVVQKDPHLWREVVKKPIPIMEYYFAHATKGKDVTRVEDKRSISQDLLAEIARLTDPIEREHWLQKLATLLRMDLPVLHQALQKASASAVPSRSSPSSAPSAASASTHKTPVAPVSSRSHLISKLIFGLFFERPEWRQEILKQLSVDLVPEGELRELYKEMSVLYTESQPSAPKSFYESLCQRSPHLAPLIQEAALIGEELLANEALPDARKQLDTALQFMRERHRQDRRQLLLSDLREAEQNGDRVRAEAVLKELQTL